jgi:uncharacterized protein YndB with AHSA1/START domain
MKEVGSEVNPLFNPELDLKLERVVPISKEKIYLAWTRPELLVQWFTPAPWRPVHASVDPKPGGDYTVTMQSPEGIDHVHPGCVLVAEPATRLVLTSCLAAGFRPSGSTFMSTEILLSDVEGGTLYTAIVRHSNAEDRRSHEEMGFHTGWSQALDQLIDLMR